VGFEVKPVTDRFTQGDHTSRFDRDSPGLKMCVPVTRENRSGRSNVPVLQQASRPGREAQNLLHSRRP